MPKPSVGFCIYVYLSIQSNSDNFKPYFRFSLQRFVFDDIWKFALYVDPSCLERDVIVGGDFKIFNLIYLSIS